MFFFLFSFSSNHIYTQLRKPKKKSKITKIHVRHSDLFDDQLRPIELELGAMDFAGFQMLSDPNATMIADPTIEDSFRRDLN